MVKVDPSIRSASYDELAALVGLSALQRAELDADPTLAAELLHRAIATAGVRFPASYAVSAFRKRRRARRVAAPVPIPPRRTGYLDEPEPSSGPPPPDVVERLRVDADLRVILGPAVAAALRRHGEPVPPWLTAG